MEGLERLLAEAVDELPPPGPRQIAYEYAKEHVGAIAIGVLVLVLSTFLWLNRASGERIPVLATPAPITPAPSPTPAPIIVHVIGAVASPGVVTVSPHSRVVDAIAVAGGLTPAADPGELNLAAPVVDGSQIRVGTKGSPGGDIRAESASPTGAGAKLDLNQATEAQLDQLPGIGPVTAKAIISWRAKNQRFTRIEQLQEVDGIGPKTFSALKEHIRV